MSCSPRNSASRRRRENADCGGVHALCTLQLRPANRANIRATNFRTRTCRSTCASAAALSSTARGIGASKNRAAQGDNRPYTSLSDRPTAARPARRFVSSQFQRARRSLRAFPVVVKVDVWATPRSPAANLPTIVGETGNEAATCKKTGIAMSARGRIVASRAPVSTRCRTFAASLGRQECLFPPCSSGARIAQLPHAREGLRP